MPQTPLSINEHKLIYHPEEVAAWKQEPAKTVPIYVEISPTGICNHRCFFCALDFMGYKPVSLELDSIKKCLRELAKCGCKSVMFAGEGEPLLYKNIVELILYASKLGLDTALTTNGIFLTKDKMVILDKLKWCKISVNGGNEDVYTKVHKAKIGDWDKLWDNITMARNYDKKRKCTLGVQIVKLRENVDSIEELILRARDAGVDYIVVKSYSEHAKKLKRGRPVKVLTELDWDLSYLEEYSDNNFKVIIRDILDEKRNYRRCYSVPYFWAYISSCGDIYGCSAHLNNPDFCYGNIKDGFSNVWFGEKRLQHCKIMKDFKLEGCRYNCRMDKVNEYLRDIVFGVKHENFI